MISRDRVRSTVAHRVPDRVPIDMGAMRSTGIMSIAYNRLKRKLGFSELPTRMYDLVQQLACPDDKVLDRFGIDVVDLGNLLTREPSLWKEWTLPDGSDCVVPHWLDYGYSDEKGRMELYHPDGDLVGVMPDGCLYFEQPYYPLAGKSIPASTEELEATMAKVVWAYPPCSPWDQAGEGHFWDWLGEASKAARASTDRAILLSFGGNLLEWGQFLFSNADFLVMLKAEPRKAERLLDMLVEIHMEKLERLVRAVGDSVDILVMGDDLGMQNGLQISPEMYRYFFKHRHGKIYRYVKDNSDMLVFLHSCGSISSVIGDLIDIGVDILNPVQTSAAGMDPKRLKEEFGRHITFWGGGCDTHRVLPKATPEDVDGHVRERIEILAAGGGFVFNQVHNVMADVPPENVIAMLDAALKYGGY